MRGEGPEHHREKKKEWKNDRGNTTEERAGKEKGQTLLKLTWYS